MSEGFHKADATLDDFLGGRVRAFQPKSGFRSGSDSVLLASAICEKSREILELGSGPGIAACCALIDRPDANALLLDSDREALDFADKNLSQNRFCDRAKTKLLDVTAKGLIRAQAGLKTDFFSSVIANPPYFDTESGTQSPDSSRKHARHMAKEEIDKWVKTAAASVAPRGETIFIHLIAALPQLLAAFEMRFGNICIIPIVPRPKENATRMLIRGIKGSRAPLSLLPPLVLHDEQGREFSPIADAIFRGKTRLHW